MRIVALCVFLLLAIHSASAADAVERLKAKIEAMQLPTVAATGLVDSANCGGSPCGGGSGLGSSLPSVDDSLRPIDDWLKAFKQQVGYGDLFTVAKATVKPLISRLKRQQQEAIDRIKQSNDAILQHVEESAAQHVYNLLRISKLKSDRNEELSEKKADAKEEESRAKEDAENAKEAKETAEKMKQSVKKANADDEASQKRGSSKLAKKIDSALSK